MDIKNIAIIGNCQATQIASTMRVFIQAHNFPLNIIDITIYNGDPGSDFMIYRNLEKCDHIYMQYHDARWGRWATDYLKDYFDTIKIIPTLESFVSTPQIGDDPNITTAPIAEFGGKGVVGPGAGSVGPGFVNLFQFGLGVDFRVLDLYLQGIDLKSAAQAYLDCKVNSSASDMVIENQINTYKNRHRDGDLYFNYGAIFEKIMEINVESYFTYNHPFNIHMDYLVRSIFLDLGYAVPPIPHRQEVFSFHNPVSLRGTRGTDYIVYGEKVELSTIVKYFYQFFRQVDKSKLESSLYNSYYHKLCRAQAL